MFENPDGTLQGIKLLAPEQFKIYVVSKLYQLFTNDTYGISIVDTGIRKGESPFELITRASKRRRASNKKLKALIADYEEWNSETTKTDQLFNQEAIKISYDLKDDNSYAEQEDDKETLHEEEPEMPKTMITIEKKVLEEKFNNLALDIANLILNEADYDTIKTFNEYDKKVINSALDRISIQLKNYFIGMAEQLFLMIKYFDVRINKRAFQMIAHMSTLD